MCLFAIFENKYSATWHTFAAVPHPIKNIPFEIPQNWQWVFLSDISIIQEGPGIRKYQYQDDGIQFLTVTNDHASQ